jgi:DNA invertase Pin-like site-specific DNA recombinase
MKTTEITKSSENQPVCVAFYRVSTDKQNNDRQIEDVRKYCKAFDFDLQKEFQETISGAAKLTQRTELQALLKYVEENKPDYIICSELSRLARSQDAVSIIKGWTDKGICFISLKENIKTLDKDGNKNPMTDLLLGILTAINVFELETIKFRVKSGLRKTANRGTWIGSVPFGYSVINQRLVINPDESETLKMMFERYSEGWSNGKIASYLNRNKITTKQGVTWKDTQVYKILKNPIVIGKRIWGGETIELPELRLIEDSIFTAVQDRLVKKTNVEPLNKQNKYAYLLSGKMVCACGKHFIGINRSKNYICKSHKYGAGCNVKSINMNYLDDAVKNLLIDNAKILYDYSGITNETKKINDEIIHNQEIIDAEKQTQNYLINNMVKIGQKKFDEKFDDSTTLVSQLQKKNDELNIKLSRTKNFMNISEDILIREYKIKDNGILRRIDVDGELIRKVIDVINIDNEKIKLSLINGSTFDIERK